MKKTRQPVSIDSIEFDALISSNETYSANVPEYPIETGYSVSDSIILNADILDLVLFVSNRPVTYASRFGISNYRVEEVIDNLKDLYMKKGLVTVTTNDMTFTNMAITNLTITKSNTMGYACEIPITLKKVRITTTSTTTIPSSYGKSGTTEAAAGTISTSTATTSSSSENSDDTNDKSGSIFYNIALSAGLLGG